MSFTRFFPAVIAHRGASAYAPENTLASFKKAHEMNYKWVEFDVMVSPADSKQTPFIFHDETLDRTTNGKGLVANYPYSELKKLDAGSWFDKSYAGEQIPSLKEVMRFLFDNDMAATVEIKPLPDEEEKTVIEALRVVSTFFPQPHPAIIFSSFSIKSLEYLRQYSPECYLSLILKTWPPEWEAICQSLNCTAITVDEKILTREKADKIKEMKMHLLCYTVDNQKRAEELFSMGVDGVFSNAPDRITGNKMV